MSPPVFKATKEKDFKPFFGLFDSYSTYTIQNPPSGIPKTIQLPRRFAWQIHNRGFFATGAFSQIQGPAYGSDGQLYLKRKSQDPLVTDMIEKVASLTQRAWNTQGACFIVQTGEKKSLFMRYFSQCTDFQVFLDKLNSPFTNSSWDCPHVLLAVMKAIQEMHAANVNHYDLKPNNLLFNYDSGRVVPIDFDGATDGDTTQASARERIIVTNFYISSSMMHRKYGQLHNGIAFNKNDDLYSLGIILFETYLAFHPEEKESFEQLITQVHQNFSDSYSTLNQQLRKYYDGHINHWDALFKLLAQNTIPNISSLASNSGLSLQSVHFLEWLLPFLQAHTKLQNNLPDNYSCEFLKDRAEQMGIIFLNISKNPLFNELTRNPTAKFELNKFSPPEHPAPLPSGSWGLCFKYIVLLGIVLSGLISATEWLSDYIYQSNTDLGGDENWHIALNQTLGDLGELPAYLSTPCVLGFSGAALMSPLIYRNTVSKNKGIRSSNQ